jgi:parvulin-like peptidyl-prolyl isomerase
MSLVLAACGTSAGAQPSAATVNGTEISMSAYQKEVHYQRTLQKEKIGLDPCTTKGMGTVCASAKKAALDNLIDVVLVRKYAKSHHIVVPESTYKRQWDIIYQHDFHREYAVLRAYAKRYGFKPGDVIRKTREKVLQDAVMFAITKQMPTRVPSTHLAKIDVKDQKQLASVQKVLKRGADFVTLGANMQREKDSLCHNLGCGDEGWIPNQFIPAGDKAIFTARVGSIVGPYVTQQYLELIKILGRDSHKATTQQQQLRMRQNKLLQWLQQQENEAHIHRNVTA